MGSTTARNRSTIARNKRTTARNRIKGRFHRGFLLDGGVVGVEEWLVVTFSDCYPRGANSIGSSPSSSRFGDYSAMVVDLSKNSNIPYISPTLAIFLIYTKLLI